MSLTTAISRIDDISTMITSLAPAKPEPVVTRAVSTANASQFATALDQAGPASTLGDGSVTGSDVVEQAKKYLGVPYVFGGEDETGMDCSGLVQRVFADLGVDVPRVVQDQDTVGREVPSLDEAQPGDLIIPHGSGHIVIYIGDGKVLHAPRPGKDVQIVDNFYSPSEISTIRRFVPADSEVAAAAPAAATGVDNSQLAATLQTMFSAQTSGTTAGAASLQNLTGLLG